jgi:endonuclease YncB( thermonuclease family)
MVSVRAHPRIFRVHGFTAPAGALALAIAFAGEPAPACGVVSGSAEVRAVDDQAQIRLVDGRLIRLGGLDIPGAARGGFDALTPARALLTAGWVGKTVSVAPLAPRPDRWGRWLADVSSPDGLAASTALLGAGLARVRPEFETRDCEEGRLETEARARAAGLGLWNDPDSIRDASDLDALRADDGLFAVIEGQVRRVGVGRSRVYLDFGRRGGFSVVAPLKAEPAFERRGVKLEALTGRRVRVRGVLEDRFGLEIELADPWMIEPLDSAEGAKDTKPGG